MLLNFDCSLFNIVRNSALAWARKPPIIEVLAHMAARQTITLQNLHARPSFAEAFRFWLKLGFISFGGPSGQIAMMHSELVERRKWIDEPRFLHALNFCMLLPGPEAQQLAIYIGWLLHKIRGGIVAGALFVLPSMFILWTLSYIYVAYGNVRWVAAIFYGLKPAVLAIVAAAVIRIGRRALRNAAMWLIAAVAFVAIYFFHVPFPAIVISAGALGFLAGRFSSRLIPATVEHDATSTIVLHNEATDSRTRRAYFRGVALALVGTGRARGPFVGRPAHDFPRRHFL